MKISYTWLREYLPVDLPAADAADLLTGCGLEVESISRWQSVKGGLEGIVIGEVLTCEKHPDSDHLSVTTVNVGKQEPLNIICGASNVAAGQKVAVATIGTRLTIGDKEITIQRAKIRGRLSEGMICAEDEIGIGTSHAGILVLDPAAVPGMPASTYFGISEDTVFEIGLTPNRTDATSHIGVARDLAAVLNNMEQAPKNTSRLAVQMPSVADFRKEAEGRWVKVTVEDSEACPRYSGVTLSNITVGESPEWLKNRLLAIGQRPINNVVDVTNFVMMETGQPLHAFDAGRIQGDHIIVKRYPDGTPFVTLDETERKLTGQDLMICSAGEPLCIAGVFGGIGSGVTPATRDIFIESAYFNPTGVRKTSKHHGIQTDSSFRFERGANPDITVYALQRAALLIRELAGGQVTSEVVDVYPKPISRPHVRLLFSHLDRLAGKILPRETVSDILTDLGMEILTKDEEGLTVSVPGFKADVHREADLIEEVLRIYGYNNIGIPDQLRSSLNVQPKPDRERLRQTVAEYLSSVGFFEIMNNSLTPSAWYEGDGHFPAVRQVRILNPLSRELDSMRQTLLFGGLETIAYNQNRKSSDLALFEFGNVYAADPQKSDQEPLPGFHEEVRLALFLTGNRTPENWNSASAPYDLFDLKGHISALFQRLNIPADRIRTTPSACVHLAAGITYEADGKKVAVAGQVNGALLKKFDCRQQVLYADFDWNLLLQLSSEAPLRVAELPKYPEVRRDLALLLDAGVAFSEVEAMAFQTEKKLLKKVALFDVYEGEKIGAGKKSYAVSFLLRDDEKTLTDSEIDAVMNRLIKAFGKQLGAVIR